MKIAVLADIHGNFRALRTVIEDLEKWSPDRVYVLGDIINRGPRSRECLETILEKCRNQNWQVVIGNHEEYVLAFGEPDAPSSGPEFAQLKFVHWTYSQLSDTLETIKKFPFQVEHILKDGNQLRAVHASMLGTRSGIYPSTGQEELPDMLAPPPDLLMVGHTHYPLVKTFKATLVANAGSVGFPFDGDIRPCYARAVRKGGRWQVNFIRLPYDHQGAVEDFTTTGYRDRGGPMVDIILKEMELARPQLSHWNHRFRQEVLNNKIPLEEAVRMYLARPNTNSLK